MQKTVQEGPKKPKVVRSCFKDPKWLLMIKSVRIAQGGPKFWPTSVTLKIMLATFQVYPGYILNILSAKQANYIRIVLH